MKKIMVMLLILISLAGAFGITCSGAEADEEYYSELLDSVIDSDTAEKLEDMGIQNFTSDEIFSISFSEIGEYFSEDLKSKSAEAVSVFFRILCVLIILIVVKAFIGDYGRSVKIIGMVTVAILSVDVCSKVLDMLLSTMKTGGNFLLSFIPIYTVILSLGGNVSSAVTYNSITFSFAQAISFIINSFSADFTGIFLSLSMAFSLNSTINSNRFISTVNKLVSTVVGFLASGFAAILSVRGVLSATIDSATSKSIKFLIGSLIPIVGSSISDAYTTVLGSINVIKGSVAVAGIVIMLVISVPPVLEGVLYCFSFAVLSYLAEMAELSETISVLRAFQSALRTVILLNIFQFFILIVSTAILITVKGGG